MKIVSITWNSYIPPLLKAGKKLGFEMEAYSSRALEEEPDKLETALKACETADLVLLYYTSGTFWDELSLKIETIKEKVPVVCTGHDAYFWTRSSVNPQIAATAYLYFTYNGEENLTNLLNYLRHEVFGEGPLAEPPKKIAWDGLFHPDTETWFSKLEDYLKWYKPAPGKTAGLLVSRTAWVNGDLKVENTLIRDLERLGLRVIPVFAYSLQDDELGTRAMGEVVEEYFMPEGTPIIDCLIKLTPFLIKSRQGRENDPARAGEGLYLLKKLDVPLVQPIISSYMTVEDWEASPGLGSDIAWYVAMPEFEGAIEPLIIGGGKKLENYVEHVPIVERCARLAARVCKLLELRNRPPAEKKVAFILHNKPCASVEGTIGCAANLDSLESVARILQRMEKAGYAVRPPADGKELIDLILKKKAYSEFRWTGIEEIVRNGGALAFVGKEEYENFFNTLSPEVQARMTRAWGQPPGEPVGEAPAAMLHEGKLVITGVKFGNAVVCVQPKRGCAGPACNGQVCKILHDPDVPPTHHYLATYRYLEEGFGADAVVHVGTHGNLEFLPGKGVGLSKNCFPDLAISTVPHFYIYNSDNPPEGSAAKRRSLACLVDHMQTVMQGGGLYAGLEELDGLLGEYEQARHDPGRSHALKHLVRDKIEEINLGPELSVGPETPFEELVRKAHEALSKLRNTQVQGGMHIFGNRPEGRQKAEFINSVLRYDDGEKKGSLRRALAEQLDLDFDGLLEAQGEVSGCGLSNGQLLEELDLLSTACIAGVLEQPGIEFSELLHDPELFKERNPKLPKPRGFSSRDALRFGEIKSRVMDLDARIEASEEIEALLHGFEGGYIEPGPSGLIMRGRADVLPTGRNFYSLDPKKIPTRAAWRVGKQLAEMLLDKYREEEGRLPENIAFYWMASDIMWADGECMAQIMQLLGVEPVWTGSGQLKGFAVIPLEELGRPRIDVTIRASGILRDNFPGSMELMDEAVQAVASLEEDPECNYVRKHTLGMLEEGMEVRDATYRIFSSKPGTYSSGVQLAVYASAWKDEKDLADVFLYWNGYAYGKNTNGEEAHTRLARNLESVDLTYNKVVSDEHDLLGCCCYFGTHGGMTAAARQASGKEVKAYFGDSREGGHPEIRALADELRRVVRSKLLNPRWIEGMKAHGYQGAGEISGRIGRVYGWEASTKAVDDWIFDEITDTFVLDVEMRAFFEEHNPYALEEISRRLLEAEARKLWNPAPELLEKLKNSYLEIEAMMEERAGEGEFQGGTVDLMALEEVPDWKEKMETIREKLGFKKG
ncbi:cobaltochelatase subunit CobN [Methanosarcina sp. KYL-1]|uniref:cobaltochelatase subunit CobN n=1 Tax=Methanosarcina sp. KYL-1 TaxID=2602068 RepID=UPI00210156FD|nr:cobaltochelatase subunit CobN [Methanosarcina sp. KYL-1]MCQ1535800.1 cobaltochelatase subunit CobN [Methanosarcina sp. KYL-1]